MYVNSMFLLFTINMAMQDDVRASFSSLLALCCSDGSCDQHGTAVDGYWQFSAAGPKAGWCREEDAGSSRPPGAHSQRETARQSIRALLERVILDHLHATQTVLLWHIMYYIQHISLPAEKLLT